MSYQSLYRKYRPRVFSDVVGQEAIVTALGNQSRDNRAGHAYLFTGTRGTGKTTVAKIFARAVNCENPAPDGSPCNECDTCRGITSGTYMNVIEIDAASNTGVDNIRTIIEEISYSPPNGKKKVYIIDEAHMLSPGASNALLKTLEEPPEYALFILATTEPGKLPATILSRCQRYDFHRMSVKTLTDRMRVILAREGADADDKALGFIARQADGSMRDALSLLDQCMAFSFGDRLTYDKTIEILGAVDISVFSEMVDCVIDADLNKAIRLLDDTVMKGRDIRAFVIDFIAYLRNLLLISTEGSTDADIADILGVSSDNYDQMKQQVKKIDTDTIMRSIYIFSELSGDMRYSSQKKVMTEIAIIRLMKPEMQDDPLALKQRLAILERKIDRLERDGVKVKDIGNAGGDIQRKKVPLPKALPEDVKMVCDNWGRIVRDAKAGIKGVLSGAKPSLDGDRLVIVCSDEVSSGMLMTDDNRAEIDSIFEREIKKKIDYTIIGPAKGEDPDTQYPDLESFINYDIEISEEIGED